MDDPDEPGVPTYVISFWLITMIGIAATWLIGALVSTILSTTGGTG